MGPPAEVRYRHIDEINNWFVQRVEVLPPSLVKIKAEGGEPIGLVATVPEPNGTAILKFSALRGFKSMTVEHLRRLALYLEIACAKQPSTEIEWVTMLVKHCVPLISDADLALALDSRRMRAKPRFDTEMTMANIHATADVLGDEVREAQQDAETFAKQVEAVKKTHFAAAGAKAKAVGKKKKVLAPKDAAALERARQFIPVRAGCALSQETHWHSRWKITYPTAFPPYSKGSPYKADDAASVRAALIDVLSWAWAHHESQVGEQCPYDLV